MNKSRNVSSQIQRKCHVPRGDVDALQKKETLGHLKKLRRRDGDSAEIYSLTAFACVVNSMRRAAAGSFSGSDVGSIAK